MEERAVVGWTTLVEARFSSLLFHAYYKDVLFCFEMAEGTRRQAVPGMCVIIVQRVPKEAAKPFKQDKHECQRSLSLTTGSLYLTVVPNALPRQERGDILSKMLRATTSNHPRAASSSGAAALSLRAAILRPASPRRVRGRGAPPAT